MFVPSIPLRGIVHRFAIILIAIATVLGMATTAAAQASISTGSIQGTVSDPSGALVPQAKVIITNKGTGQVLTFTTNSAGSYNSGSLIPGDYKVRVEAKGFRTSELPVTVEVGTIASGNIKLEVGETSQVVEVQSSAVQVNTEQATVQGVVTPSRLRICQSTGAIFGFGPTGTRNTSSGWRWF